MVDVDALKEHHSVYTLLTNDDGGIIDDAILTCTGQNSYYLVSNASRADEVMKRLKVIIGIYFMCHDVYGFNDSISIRKNRLRHTLTFWRTNHY